MKRPLTYAFLFVLALCTDITQAGTPLKRTALVLGISSQQQLSALPHASIEARQVAQQLKKLNFRTIEGYDLDRETLRAHIRKFGNQLKQTKGEGVVYFVGHSLRFKNQNYIIPANATINSYPEVPDVGVSINTIMEQMAFADNHLNVIIMNTGYDPGMQLKGQALKAGLATVEGPKGSFIGMANQPDTINPMPEQDISLFGKTFLGLLEKPGVSLESLFKSLRNELLAKSNNKITVWQSSSLLSDFYFYPGQKTEKSRPDQSADLKAWQAIQSSNRIQDFEHYIENHPDSPLIRVANLKIRQLKRKGEPAQASQLQSRSLDGVDKVINKAAKLLPPYPLSAENLRQAEEYWGVIQSMTATDDPRIESLRQGIVEGYAKMAKIAHKENEKEKALKIIQRGRQFAPGDKQLKRLEDKYSGDEGWF